MALAHGNGDFLLLKTLATNLVCAVALHILTWEKLPTVYIIKYTHAHKYLMIYKYLYVYTYRMYDSGKGFPMRHDEAGKHSRDGIL
jgi:hypothetical protein